ncbi:MAG: hypothetical protein BAJALOKI2v1_1110012 [Promethearchaeota archaeon]|nr:MAG: hypothetical protein BAJALOKI2v1_1110012 [Candidatus Lokiarchaeota archaeon]
MTIFFIDTNILWWYFVKNSKYHKSVKKFLDPLILDTENSFIVNEFVMIEFPFFYICNILILAVY